MVWPPDTVSPNKSLNANIAINHQQSGIPRTYPEELVLRTIIHSKILIQCLVMLNFDKGRALSARSRSALCRSKLLGRARLTAFLSRLLRK